VVVATNIAQKGIIRFKKEKRKDDGCDRQFCADTERQIMKVEKAKSDKWIDGKISELIKEGKPRDQAVAIAYSMSGKTKGEAKKAVMKAMKYECMKKSEDLLLDLTKRGFCDDPFSAFGCRIAIKNPVYSPDAFSVDDSVAKSFENIKKSNGEMLPDPLRKSK